MKLYKDYKRHIHLFAAVCFVFCVCFVKIILIQSRISESVSAEQSTKTIVLEESRGYIYDRNLLPLVNNEKIKRCIVISNSVTNGLINELLLSSERDESFDDGIVVITSENQDINENEYIKEYTAITRYSEIGMLGHIIGYTDADGNGVCGIEKAFDKILNDAGGKISAQLSVNSRGEALSGKGLIIDNNNYDSPAGVVLTIDKNIQGIVEKAICESGIDVGAVVVMDVNSFEILATASFPCYDINNLQAALNGENQPFLNRSFNAYPVGSVIKPFIAAAAIENGINVYEMFECSGATVVNSTQFACFNYNSHGYSDLNSAIENSCNCYFINIGINSGKEKIISCLSEFGFGKNTDFCSALSSASGTLPTCSSITSDAQLANICFGQGELLATPVQLAAAYSVIANGGLYKEPTILRNLIDDSGKIYAYYKSDINYSVVEENTCEIIKTALYNNMINGTGKNAASTYIEAAGKTATAQTGRYDDNGEEILCTWFAGFFPYESPRYTVVVFNENGSTAALDCAPVFKKISEEIYRLYY